MPTIIITMNMRSTIITRNYDKTPVGTKDIVNRLLNKCRIGLGMQQFDTARRNPSK